MRAVKIGGLVVAVVVIAVVLYQVLVFAREAGDLFLATLRSGQRTAEYNEQIAASLAGAKLGDRLTSRVGGLESALNEMTQTLPAVRPVIADTAATVGVGSRERTDVTTELSTEESAHEGEAT